MASILSWPQCVVSGKWSQNSSLVRSKPESFCGVRSCQDSAQKLFVLATLSMNHFLFSVAGHAFPQNCSIKLIYTMKTFSINSVFVAVIDKNSMPSWFRIWVGERFSGWYTWDSGQDVIDSKSLEIEGGISIFHFIVRYHEVLKSWNLCLDL